MLKRNRLILAAALTGLFASPAMADGRDRVFAPGPTPLVPHETITCPEGTIMDEDGICRAVEAKLPPPPAVIPASAPAPSYDFSGFSGGVGSAVSSGYTGGGRVIVIGGSERRYSGVRQYQASSSQSFSYTTTRINIGGGGGGMCGCN